MSQLNKAYNQLCEIHERDNGISRLDSTINSYCGLKSVYLLPIPTTACSHDYNPMKKNIAAASLKSKKNSKPIKSNLAPKPFPIVGIGASAGGVKAFTTFLEHLNPNLGLY